MKIKFDAFEIAKSPLHEEGKNYSRPVVIDQQTTPTEDIMEKASGESTLTPIDIRAVIDSLARHLRLQLLRGNAVHLDGIGTFSLSLRFADPTKNLEDITARDINVSGVNFIPDRQFLTSLRSDIQFERSSAFRSAPVDEDAAVEALRKYFQDNTVLTKQEFQHLLGLKYGRATKILQSLLSKDMLTVSRIGQTNFYHPSPNLLK